MNQNLLGKYKNKIVRENYDKDWRNIFEKMIEYKLIGLFLSTNRIT
jgi:hypothetical protein